MIVRACCVAFALSLSACSPVAETKPAEGVDVPTPRNPFFGTWELTTARIAPWADQQAGQPQADPSFAKIVFAADMSSGPKLLACDKPLYATNIVAPRDLFAGKLAAPAQDAPAMGFTSPDVTVMSFSCQTGGNDTLADFPMRDDGSIMLALDGVLYTYQRTGN